MPNLISQLNLSRCPCCNVDTPSIHMVFGHRTTNYDGSNERHWKVYSCVRCGGLITASSYNDGAPVIEMYPKAIEVDEAIPQRARVFLQQALDSKHAPSGAVMLAASSIDAMLKNKKYKDGSLNSRIDKAAKDHLITKEMAEWAHNVRLDANEQRHADEVAPLPDENDARHSIDFAIALGEFLFVLPSKVKQGLQESQPSTVTEQKAES